MNFNLMMGCQENAVESLLSLSNLANRARPRVHPHHQRSSALVKHRGADWSGMYQHGDCFFAHQRLAIIDPACGDQPLYSEDKSIVFMVNRETYNHAKLRSRLPNHIYKLSRLRTVGSALQIPEALALQILFSFDEGAYIRGIMNFN